MDTLPARWQNTRRALIILLGRQLTGNELDIFRMLADEDYLRKVMLERLDKPKPSLDTAETVYDLMLALEYRRIRREASK